LRSRHNDRCSVRVRLNPPLNGPKALKSTIVVGFCTVRASAFRGGGRTLFFRDTEGGEVARDGRLQVPAREGILRLLELGLPCAFRAGCGLIRVEGEDDADAFVLTTTRTRASDPELPPVPAATTAAWTAIPILPSAIGTVVRAIAPSTDRQVKLDVGGDVERGHDHLLGRAEPVPNPARLVVEALHAVLARFRGRRRLFVVIDELGGADVAVEGERDRV
jgi:hypothetical protein